MCVNVMIALQPSSPRSVEIMSQRRQDQEQHDAEVEYAERAREKAFRRQSSEDRRMQRINQQCEALKRRANDMMEYQ